MFAATKFYGTNSTERTMMPNMAKPEGWNSIYNIVPKGASKKELEHDVHYNTIEDRAAEQER